MKILYAIQGTGNGHITCALDLLPRLMKKADVDILISGCQVDVTLPHEVKYKLNGLSFIFGKKGGINYLETYKRSKLKKLYHEITELPVQDYDLVISDFEPVSAWACYIKKIPCIGLSHQAAVLNKKAPKPKKSDVIGKAVLKYYAPADILIGYHYLSYDENILTALIRKEIRRMKVRNLEHYTVYLPAFSDKRIIRLLEMFPEIEWHVFSKHSQEAYTIDNIVVLPVNNKAFVESMAGAEGVLCGAGFQTPAEVLFLKKKLMVIPMKGQYEQQCNAAALKELNVPVLKNLKKKRYNELKEWIENPQEIEISFPDIADSVVDLLLKQEPAVKESKMKQKTVNDFRSFRKLLKRKIFSAGV